MKVLHALREGWRRVLLHARMWFILYLCNLLFALVAVMPFRKWFNKTAGHSLLTDQSRGAFDLTFIGDLLRNYKGFSTLISQLSILALAYFVLSAFLTGGVLYIYINSKEKFLYRDFVTGGLALFWRFLRLAFYFLLIQAVVLGVFVFVIMFLGVDPMQMESDVTFFRRFKILFAVYCFLAIVVAMVHDYVKIHIVSRNENPFSGSFRAGWRFVLRNFGAVLLLYLLNLGILIALFIVYKLITGALPAGTHSGTMLGFIFSQFFLIGRIGVKLLTLCSACALVQWFEVFPQPQP